ncbi:MAG: DUF3500 domain-containing protein [Bacteroidota bacterium]
MQLKLTFAALLIVAFTWIFWTENTTRPASDNALPANTTDAPANATMREAAKNFISLTTDASQQEKLHWAFSDDERLNWNFVPIPGKRQGLAVESMSTQQRAALHALLQSVLSTKGYLKTTGVQQLERILGEIENRPKYRDPLLYYLTIFGTPAADSAWGWRFEGHHLSLNFSSIADTIDVVPAFWGANPAEVKTGPFTGLRLLSEEIDVARQLMRTFSTEQKQQVIIADTAPRDIITGNSREAMLERTEGLAYAAMTAEQQQLVIRLIDVYLGNMKPEVAAHQRAHIEAAGYDTIHFAWAGSESLGQGHYYRLHGTTLLIEYDNTQTNANHIHTVWRDLQNDFGRDLLHQHYNASSASHTH